MSHKALLESSLQIPHFDRFVGRATHQKVLLLRETELQYWAWVGLNGFMLPVSEYFNAYTEFFQIRIYRSSPHEITFEESALKRTSLTCPLCPTNLKGRICGLKFQTYTNPSAPPETICFLHSLLCTSRVKIQRSLLIFNVLESSEPKRGLQLSQWFWLIL